MPRAAKAKQPKAPLAPGFVGKGSKSQRPECSQAMSTWVRARNAGQQVASAIFAMLGKCRAYARQKKLGERLASGGSLKGQVIAHRLEKGGLDLASAKARAAKAAELRAQRGMKQAASVPAPVVAPEYIRPKVSGSLRQQQASEKRAATIAKKKAADAWNAGREDPAVAASRIQREQSFRSAPMTKPASHSSGLEEVMAAAQRVHPSKVSGGKVMLHHVWAEYRKGGGKLSLNDFKQKLADSPQARLTLGLGRQDMPQTRRPGDMKASGVKSGPAEFNHMRVPTAGTGEGLKPRAQAAGETKGRAAALVASKRKPAGNDEAAVLKAFHGSKGAKDNFPSLADMREGAGLSRERFDAAVHSLRKKGVMSLDIHEGLSNPPEWATNPKAKERFLSAGISDPSGGKPYTYAQLKDHDAAKAIMGTAKPAEAATIGHKPGESKSAQFAAKRQALESPHSMTEDQFVKTLRDAEGRKDMARGNAVRLVQAAAKVPKKRAEEIVGKIEATRAGTAHFSATGGNGYQKPTAGIDKGIAFLPSEAVYRAAHQAAGGHGGKTMFDRKPGTTAEAPGPPSADKPFSLLQRGATGSKGAENQGRGITKTMFDMKKGDLKGQTSIFDKVSTVETHPKGKQIAKLQGAPGEAAISMKPVSQSPREALAKQRAATAGRIKELKGGLELANITKTPEGFAQHAKAGDLGHIPTQHLVPDPKRFQYKDENVGSKGVTDQFKDTKVWNEHLGGTIQAWRDPADHKVYVVNGHHRLELAQRLGVKNLKVELLDAPDASTARAIGAIQNIGEGRGTVRDAATFLHENHIRSKAELEKHGLSLSENVTNKGISLASLEPGLYKQYKQGILPEERGAIIGGSGLDHAQQTALMKSIKPNTSNSKLREHIDNAQAAPKATEKIHSLFGTDENEVSLAHHRVDIQDHIKRGLMGDEKLFKLVSKSKAADALAERGRSHIDTEATKQVGQEAAAVLGAFHTLKNRSGPVARALNHASERLHAGEPREQVIREARDEVRKEVARMLRGGTQAFAA